MVKSSFMADASHASANQDLRVKSVAVAVRKLQAAPLWTPGIPNVIASFRDGSLEIRSFD